MDGTKPSSLVEFLDFWRLSHHTKLLEGQGYENLGDLFVLSEQDLDNVHIMDQQERATILNAVDNIDISTWLTYYGLEAYERLFRSNHITSVERLKEIDITDDVMDQLEVMVPGHRKRLTMAVNQFSISNDVASNDEPPAQRLPLALGYWGRNDQVPTRKTELLWVKCTMKSNVPERSSVELEFMVDTGSEVVTCTKEIVEELGLVFIRIITSKGIHKTEEKPIYHGTLVLGGKELPVEVMPDEYNSVGCNVFRAFSHLINDHGHVWMPKE